MDRIGRKSLVRGMVTRSGLALLLLCAHREDRCDTIQSALVQAYEGNTQLSAQRAQVRSRLTTRPGSSADAIVAEKCRVDCAARGFASSEPSDVARPEAGQNVKTLTQESESFTSDLHPRPFSCLPGPIDLRLRRLVLASCWLKLSARSPHSTIVSLHLMPCCPRCSA